METFDERCMTCGTYLSDEGACPNGPCPAFGKTVRFSGRPVPRRSFEQLIAVRPDAREAPPVDDDEERPTPIEIPVTASGIRRPRSGEFPIDASEAEEKASNDES